MSPNDRNNPVIFDARKKNWFWDFNGVFESDLSPHAKLIRLFLARCADNETRSSYPSLNTICFRCGISKHTVIKAIRELEEKGWIKKNIRYLKRSEYGKAEYTSTEYHLLDVPTVPPDHEKTSDPGPKAGSTASMRGGASAPPPSANSR